MFQWLLKILKMFDMRDWEIGLAEALAKLEEFNFTDELILITDPELLGEWEKDLFKQNK